MLLKFTCVFCLRNNTKKTHSKLLKINKVLTDISCLCQNTLFGIESDTCCWSSSGDDVYDNNYPSFRIAISIYIVVQFILGSNFISFCFPVQKCMRMNLKQREITFKARIKLNCNIHTQWSWCFKQPDWLAI